MKTFKPSALAARCAAPFLLLLLSLPSVSCGEQETHSQARSREDRKFIADELARFRKEFKEELSAGQVQEVLRQVGPTLFENERELLREELRDELIDEARKTASQECWSVCQSMIVIQATQQVSKPAPRVPASPAPKPPLPVPVPPTQNSAPAAPAPVPPTPNPAPPAPAPVPPVLPQ